MIEEKTTTYLENIDCTDAGEYRYAPGPAPLGISKGGPPSVGYYEFLMYSGGK